MWGVALYGPMLFADEDTRTVVANQPDENGALHKQGDVFVGKLPPEVNIANTATDWAGVKWTMIGWPLPDEKNDRVRLMMHELFHRIQDSIKLPANNPANNHLDSKNGRIWLRMEWRALEHATFEQGKARQSAVADALFFRRYRQSLFPQALAEETSLETNEGLAEYTGVRLAAHSEAERLARAYYNLRRAVFKPTFARSFAYVTGPAYGLLLDSVGDHWRHTIKSGDDLSAILQQALKIKLPALSEAEALSRARHYDGGEVIADETERDKHHTELVAKYRAKLVDGPVLILPVANSFNFSFDPNDVVALDDSSTIYPKLRVTDDWGVLEVSDGALMFRSSKGFTKLQVAAPSNAQARPLQGEGWKLELNPAWTLVPGTRNGDFLLEKKKD